MEKKSPDAKPPKNQYINESRLIVQILRHELCNIAHDARGFVTVDDLILLIEKRNLKKIKPLTLQIVSEIVNYDTLYSKQRMQLVLEDTKWKICANQGHSSGRTEYTEVTEPVPNLIHGTEKNFQDSIAENGLLRMTRTHIHCIACDPNCLDTAVIISGFKKQSNLIVVIDMAATMKDGLKWQLSDNGVYLTVGPILPKYLRFIDL